MARKNVASSRERNAPDTARVYERARPEAEAGMGKLAVPRTRRSKKPDRMVDAVTHRQENRQLNADDIVNAAGNEPATKGR